MEARLVPRGRESVMSQRIVHRLIAAGAVAAVLAAGPAQAQEGPREAAGKIWQWLGSFQERAVLTLRLWTGEAVPRKAGPMVDPNGSSGSTDGKAGHLIDPDGASGSTAPSCQDCNDAGHLIDPNG